MSQSTDAKLFYGYCWADEEKIIPGEDETEWSEQVLRKRGVVSPWDEYPEANPSLSYTERDKVGEAFVQTNRARIDEWRKANKAVEAEFGVGVGYHCSGDCAMPFLAITDTLMIARRGYPEEINSVKMMIQPDWSAKLDRFLAEFGIEKPHDVPKWWLVSYWC